MNQILQMLGLGPEKIIDSLGNVIDKFITTPGEKEQAKLELAKEINRNFEALNNLDFETLKAQMGDTSNARQRDMEANNSEKAGWLSKNISPLLAITIILLTFTLYAWILIGGDYLKERENVIFAVLGSLTTMSAGIISYYFGSSIGATKHRDALLENMRKTNLIQ
jgi:hypothetical protein